MCTEPSGGIWGPFVVVLQYDNFSLLTGVFRPFKFNVIVDMANFSKEFTMLGAQIFGVPSFYPLFFRLAVVGMSPSYIIFPVSQLISCVI